MNFLKITEKISGRNVAFLAVFALTSFALAYFLHLKINERTRSIVEDYNRQSKEAGIKALELKQEKMNEKMRASLAEKPLLNFPPPNMQRMKRQGCVVDGLLNGYNKGTENATELVNRSNCYYLHRSIETWLDPPDFEKIEEMMKRVKKDRKDLVYGMFIAEAIGTKDNYFYETENREFEFDEMCRSGSKNDWGEHTCKPSLKKKEYRLYVLDITKKAMELGVQSFMFGQIYYQDSIDESYVSEILREMRAYAKARGIEIVIGAQTNDIDDEKYLRQFDFIEGGVGIDKNGRVEEGPCYSRWWKKEGDWCWALLWNERFSKKANNVFVHLDWSGIRGDDMGNFANMSREKRAETLGHLSDYFKRRNIGFIMPMIAPLYKENGGCYGRTRKYYSSDNAYSCKDEDVINKLLIEN